jgi:hypothetical protein
VDSVDHVWYDERVSFFLVARTQKTVLGSCMLQSATIIGPSSPFSKLKYRSCLGQ